MDAVVMISTDAEKALAMKESMVAAFLDIEKAYDCMWQEGLFIRMREMGIGGRMYNFVLDFLSGRRFCVRVGSEVSDGFDVVQGVPQGSVISPVLFNMMVNGVFESLKPGTLFENGTLRFDLNKYEEDKAAQKCNLPWFMISL